MLNLSKEDLEGIPRHQAPTADQAKRRRLQSKVMDAKIVASISRH